ncbi:hypothetical protein LDENG_00138950 [Lucifuga dentata]|nr:hypothetical protein LDENG_00138950 [Lucifuga dentata]
MEDRWQPFVRLTQLYFSQKQRTSNGPIQTAVQVFSITEQASVIFPTMITMSRLDRNLQQATGPNLVSIDRIRNLSELLTAESKRLILECDSASKRMQQDANKKLDQRLRDIQFLKQELEGKLEEMTVEIDSLTELKGRVEKALEACEDPLRVTTLCLEERMKRFLPDRLHDEVDKELLMEKGVIEGVSSLLQQVLEQIAEQIRLNRSAKYHLEKDLEEKFKAQSIDDSCTLMSNHSIRSHQESKDNKMIPTSMAVTPEEWEDFSDINIAKAEQQKTNSLSLRALVDSVLEQTAADLQRQVQATEAAFERNIKEIKAAKRKMEDQLSKILSECASQQRNREDLLQAITEKEKFRNVAEARLCMRSQRPGKELCHDPAQTQLLAEVQQHTAHIDKMRVAVAQSEEKLRTLVCCQVELQKNIEIKAKSLYIDEVVCTQLRKPVIIRNF